MSLKCETGPQTSLRTLPVFWVPRVAVERLVYHIEPDVENKTSRSQCQPSPSGPWAAVPSRSSTPQCPSLQGGGVEATFQMLHGVWTADTAAPSVCGHSSPRFTVCVALTSGRPHLFTPVLSEGLWSPVVWTHHVLSWITVYEPNHGLQA